eukprot:209748-Amphidinium_carterae.1
MKIQAIRIMMLRPAHRITCLPPHRSSEKVNSQPKNSLLSVRNIIMEESALGNSVCSIAPPTTAAIQWLFLRRDRHSHQLIKRCEAPFVLVIWCTCAGRRSLKVVIECSEDDELVFFRPLPLKLERVEEPSPKSIAHGYAVLAAMMLAGYVRRKPSSSTFLSDGTRCNDSSATWGRKPFLNCEPQFKQKRLLNNILHLWISVFGGLVFFYS